MPALLRGNMAVQLHRDTHSWQPKHGSRCAVQKQVFTVSFSGPAGSHYTGHNTTPVTHTGTAGTSGLDISTVERAVQGLFQLGLAPSTTRMYKAVQRRYLDFCRDYAVTCLPLSDMYVCCLSGAAGREAPDV